MIRRCGSYRAYENERRDDGIVHSEIAWLTKLMRVGMIYSSAMLAMRGAACCLIIYFVQVWHYWTSGSINPLAGTNKLPSVVPCGAIRCSSRPSSCVDSSPASVCANA